MKNLTKVICKLRGKNSKVEVANTRRTLKIIAAVCAVDIDLLDEFTTYLQKYHEKALTDKKERSPQELINWLVGK